MREKEVEKRLVDRTKARGGLALKFVSPGFDGVPDRLVLLPKAKLGFVEVKAPGKTSRPLQIKRMSRLLIEKPGMLFKSELAKGNKDCRKEFVIGAMLAFYQAELFAKIVGRCL